MVSTACGSFGRTCGQSKIPCWQESWYQHQRSLWSKYTRLYHWEKISTADLWYIILVSSLTKKGIITRVLIACYTNQLWVCQFLLYLWNNCQLAISSFKASDATLNPFIVKMMNTTSNLNLICFHTFVYFFSSVDSPACGSWRRICRHSEIPCWQRSRYQHQRKWWGKCMRIHYWW